MCLMKFFFFMCVYEKNEWTVHAHTLLYKMWNEISKVVKMNIWLKNNREI